MMGSLQVTDTIEIQINGLFVMALTADHRRRRAHAVLLALGPAGARRRAEPHHDRRRRHRHRRVDRLTFGLGCGIAGIAGSAFTMIGSTGPTAGQLYIVDTFLVVVFGGAQACSAPSPRRFTISQSQSTLEFFLIRLDGQGASRC